MSMTPHRYRIPAAAYVRGAAQDVRLRLPRHLIEAELDSFTDGELDSIIAAGEAAGLPLHAFKSNSLLPRARRVLGFLRSIEMESLFDVGSGRGAFLWPCLDAFPTLRVQCVDLLPHRVDRINAVSRGGVKGLSAVLGNLCTLNIAAKSFDVVTMLEVLEHIPDTLRAVQSAVRIAKRYVVVSVPSKPDENPDHIHLLTKEMLTDVFHRAGVSRLHFDGVSGHLILIAALEAE